MRYFFISLAVLFFSTTLYACGHSRHSTIIYGPPAYQTSVIYYDYHVYCSPPVFYRSVPRFCPPPKHYHRHIICSPHRKSYSRGTHFGFRGSRGHFSISIKKR